MATAAPSLLFICGLVAAAIGVGLEFGTAWALIFSGVLLAAGAWLFVRGSWTSSAAS